MTTPTADQMQVIVKASAEFWQVPIEYAANQLDAIKIIKFTGGKVSGVLPSCSDFPSVFFKAYFNNAFLFEKAGLEAAAKMPMVEGVRTPTVLSIMPDQKAIIMEKRSWEDTSSPWKRLWVNRLGIDWFKVGKWLRAFHDTQVTTERNDYFLRKKFEKFEFYLNELQSLFSETQLGKMRAIAQNAKEYFQNNTCEWVISHGDFGLDNIKKSGSELEIIDFEDCQPAPRAFDLLNCIIRMNHFFLRPRVRFHNQRINNCLLAGYGYTFQLSPGEKFLELLIRLDLLETYKRRANDKSIDLHKKAVYSFFKNQKLNEISFFINKHVNSIQCYGLLW